MLRYAAIIAIRIYRWGRPISWSRCCIYRPTCTHYAMEAFRIHGFLRGLALTRDRLKRCNEFEPSGYDPVPPPDQITFAEERTPDGNVRV